MLYNFLCVFLKFLLFINILVYLFKPTKNEYYKNIKSKKGTIRGNAIAINLTINLPIVSLVNVPVFGRSPLPKAY